MSERRPRIVVTDHVAPPVDTTANWHALVEAGRRINEHIRACRRRLNSNKPDLTEQIAADLRSRIAAYESSAAILSQIRDELETGQARYWMRKS